MVERLRAAVASGLDGDLVARAEGQEAAVLTPDLLHVLDEPVEVERVGMCLEPLEVDHHAFLALVPGPVCTVTSSQAGHLLPTGGTPLRPENLTGKKSQTR